MNSRGSKLQDNEGDRFELPMLFAAAHELKSPLALIRQMSSQLENGDLSQESIDTLLARIRLTSERSLRLVNDLTLSKRLDNLQLFELEPLSPQAICDDVAREMTPLFTARNRQIRVRTKSRQALAIANPQLLRSILFQFSDNALQYATVGRPVELITRSSRDQKRVSISVRDYGPAISSDIWRRLMQTGNETAPVARRPGSSGLGLYIARRFAENMGATIGIIRHRDGASFYVELNASTQTSFL